MNVVPSTVKMCESRLRIQDTWKHKLNLVPVFKICDYLVTDQVPEIRVSGFGSVAEKWG